MSTKVVHVRRDAFTRYIGRPMPGFRSIGWGNPFRGENAIPKYLQWIQHQPKLLARLPELKDQVLGCWCAPKGGLPADINGRVCHGEVLAALADGVTFEGVMSSPSEADREAESSLGARRDVVVTVPLSFGLDTWIDEGDAAGDPWSGEEWDFYLAGPRPNIKPGDRVYVVYNGVLRGYAPLLRLDGPDDSYFVRRRGLHAFSLVRGGGAVAVTIPEHIRGFRGWRYRWWPRELETAFPNWKDPDARIGFSRRRVRA